MSGATIGENCSLGQNVFVAGHCAIGNNVKIQNNVSIYEGVTLEDDVFCGPSMVFTNVRTPRSAFPRNTAADYADTRVKRGASIGANATIVAVVTINEWAFVAAGPWSPGTFPLTRWSPASPRASSARYASAGSRCGSRGRRRAVAGGGTGGRVGGHADRIRLRAASICGIKSLTGTARKQLPRDPRRTGARFASDRTAPSIRGEAARPTRCGGRSESTPLPPRRTI